VSTPLRSAHLVTAGTTVLPMEGNRVARAGSSCEGMLRTAQLPTGKSIAVLPFLDLSERRDQEYFADGLAEEVIDLPPALG
jgi:hypothetical protein